MLDPETLKLEDKKFLANSKDRSLNTDKLVKKLDTLTPKDFPEQIKVSLEGAELVTIKGVQGDKGDTGDKGEKGDKGEQGIQGKQGLKGLKGDKGVPGEKGEPGADSSVPGPQGPQGKAGKAGKDGSPDTAEQIVEKLASLKKAWIELSQIKGIQDLINQAGNDWLNQAKGFVPRSLDSLYDVAVRGVIQDGQSLIYSAALQKWVPGTGVGSGSLAVETPGGAIDGNNTTFTVSNTPVFITMNGQVLVGSGVDYSYSAGSFTTVLTPQTGDILRSFHN